MRAIAKDKIEGNPRLIIGTEPLAMFQLVPCVEWSWHSKNSEYVLLEAFPLSNQSDS